MRTVIFALLLVLLGCSGEQPELRGDAAVIDGRVKPDPTRDGQMSEGRILLDAKVPPDIVSQPDSDLNKRPCYAGPPGTAGKGICQTGVQHRNKTTGQWGLCQGEVLPRGWDVCGDGLDTNCDGSKVAGCKTLIYLGGEIKGKVIEDTSGNKRDGTIVYGNVFSAKSGIGGKSLKFANGRVVVPIKIGSEFTLSLWARTGRKQAQYVVYAVDYGSKSLIDLNMSTSGGVKFNLVSSGVICNVYPLPAKSVNDGKWHLLTVTARSKEITIYLDAKRGSVCKNISNPSLPFTSIGLGKKSDKEPGVHYEGEMDELWFAERAWKPAEIVDFFQFRKPK